jgi:ATP-dependent DNA helicase RecQ
VGTDGVALWKGEGKASAAPLAELSREERDVIVAAVDRLRRPVGRRKLAQALRGGKAKSLARGGLLTLPEYGTLSQYSEDDVVGAIDGLLRDGGLQKTGRKYPTVWIPGKPIQERRSRISNGEDREGNGQGDFGEPDSPARSRVVSKPRYWGDVARALDNYRKRTARKLGWKTYMVFQRNVMMAIDRVKPESLEELERVPGMGPAKVERFGEDVLALVREFRGKTVD